MKLFHDFGGLQLPVTYYPFLPGLTVETVLAINIKNNIYPGIFSGIGLNMGYGYLRGIIFKCFNDPGYFALIRAAVLSFITVPAFGWSKI